MNDEKTLKLIEKHEYMFSEMKRSKEVLKKQNFLQDEMIKANKEGDQIKLDFIVELRNETGSYYPIAFGFECDDGWFELLDELMTEIEKIDIEKIANLYQVKEKYGGLRFDLDYSNREIDKIVDEYQEKSYYVCEICGKEGELCVANHWYKTVCPEHRELETWAGIKQHYIPVKDLKKE